MPPYPSRARQLGQQGTVILLLLIGPNGRVLRGRVDRSSGYPLLDGSALHTVVQQWRFKPGTVNGKPVASWVRVPVEFSIGGS